MKLILTLFSILVVLVIIYDSNIHKAAILRYPFFWLVIFSAFYLLLPGIFIDEISDEYGWDFNDESILIARLGSFYWGTIFIFFYFYFRKNINGIFSYAKLDNVTYRVVIYILLALTSWLLWVVITQASITLARTITEGYIGNIELGDDNKIKNIAYLFIPLICILSIHNKYIYWLIGVSLIFFIDVAQGARTTAFIVLTASYIAIAIGTNKLYAVSVVIIASALYSIGILFRTEELLNIDKIPIHLSMLGEFRETYIPFPYVITSNLYLNGNLVDAFIAFIYPIFGPIRSILSSIHINPGNLIATEIGRGYGLGLNAMYESYYYLNYPGILIWPWIICFASYLCMQLMKKENWVGLTFVVFFAIFSRLIFREGFIGNSGLFLYLSTILIAIPILLKKVFMSEPGSLK